MIIIFSESDDRSTTEVIKWLRYFNFKDVKRINENEPNFHFIFKMSNAKNTEVILTFNNENLPIKDIKNIWFRRAHYNTINNEIKKELKKFSELKKDILNFLIKENNVLKHILWNEIYKRKNIGNPYKQNLNKLIVLKEAKSLGIKIPNTIVSHINEVENDAFITKALSDGPIWELANSFVSFKTYDMNIEKFRGLSDIFFPTLIQQKIDKLFEIRSFYLNGSFYSMAIFSQENEKTKLDFRNYDKSDPNRNIPFKLPFNVEKKLDRLMRKLSLNCGSIDIIYSKEKEYVFLEINPVGQYDMVSYPCNYFLHKLIAEYLIRE